METYVSILVLTVATSVSALIVAGCGFVILGMWAAVKDRLWPI